MITGVMRSSARVLHIFRAMNCGGAETAIMNVNRNLEADDPQFDFAVMTKKSAYYDAEILQSGGRILALPDPNKDGRVQYYRALKKMLVSEGPYAAVHSHVHHFSGVVLRAAHHCGVPVRIAHSHTAETSVKSLWRAIYRRQMKGLIRRHATVCIGNSREANEDLFGDKASQIIRNIVDLSQYTKQPTDSREIRTYLGVPENSVLVGHVGRFDPVKNHSFLIRTFAKFAEIVTSAHLLLVGDGPLRTETDGLVRELRMQGRVTFAGLRANIPEILSALDLFVFPSVWEGLGMALVEAQAAGVVCLASSSIPREVDLGLGLAFFQDLELGPDRWAEAAARLIGTPRPAWREREKSLCFNGYDTNSVLNSLRTIYRGDPTVLTQRKESLCADPVY